ncbi:hypothetical protein G7046_g7679 [Stylonectria norvegica]|nr:hypothetical protein G7046_g7679 [Stylonectria norvegica]
MSDHSGDWFRGFLDNVGKSMEGTYHATKESLEGTYQATQEAIDHIEHEGLRDSLRGTASAVHVAAEKMGGSLEGTYLAIGEAVEEHVDTVAVGNSLQGTACAVQETAQKATEWTARNPEATVLLGTGAAIVAAPALVAVPALAVSGFRSRGIAKNSLASSTQSAIGTVVAPSVFATLQSAGAGGYGVTAVFGVARCVGLLLMGASALLAGSKKEYDGEEDECEEENE